MTLSFGEKIKLDNFKAHYNSMLHQIQDANKELERVLTLRDGQKKINSRLEKKILELGSTVGLLGARSKYLESYIQNIETKQEETSRSFEERSGVELDKLRKTRGELDTKIAYSRSERDHLKTEIEQIQSIENEERIRLEELQKKVLYLTDLIKEDLIEDSSELERVRTLLADENKSLVDIKKLVEGQNKELNNLEGQTESQANKVKTPMLLLKEREERLEEKERDFQILTLRWKRFFEEHFPNQELKL